MYEILERLIMFIVYHLDYDLLENLSEEMKDTQDYYVFKSLPVQFKMSQEVKENLVFDLAQSLDDNKTSEDTIEVMKEYLNFLRVSESYPRIENVHFALENGLYKKSLKIEAKTINEAMEAITRAIEVKLGIKQPRSKKSVISVEQYSKDIRQPIFGDLYYDVNNKEAYVLNNIGLAPVDSKYLDLLGV